MDDCAAYDAVCQSVLSYIEETADKPIASIAGNVEQEAPAREARPSRSEPESLSERLLSARRAVCANPFDRAAFDGSIVGLEECAEKRYLMAVAAMRSSAEGFVPDSAAQDIGTAMRLDPGNPEYLQFAEGLLECLADKSLRDQIEGEYSLILDLAARGVPERGGWR